MSNIKEDSAPIYLDKDGYEKYLADIEVLRKDLSQNSKLKSEAYDSAVGDGWHDNFAFEEAKRQEIRIMEKIREKVAGLSRIVIVDKIDNKCVADINSFVGVEISFANDDPEFEIYKLVGTSIPNLYSDVNEISINSPLGKTIYRQSVGYRGSYSVNGNSVMVEIKKIGNTIDEVSDNNPLINRM